MEEIIADAFGVGVASKRVRAEYEALLEKGGSEFEILLDADIDHLKGMTLPDIAKGIIRVREGKVNIEPGYDGEYGKIEIFSEKVKENLSNQKKLL